MRDVRGRTCLAIACEMGHLPLVIYLVENFGYSNRPLAYHSLTPFMLAVIRENVPVVEWLVENLEDEKVLLDELAMIKLSSIIEESICRGMHRREERTANDRLRILAKEIGGLGIRFPPELLHLIIEYTQALPPRFAGTENVNNGNITSGISEAGLGSLTSEFEINCAEFW